MPPDHAALIPHLVHAVASLEAADYKSCNLASAFMPHSRAPMMAEHESNKTRMGDDREGTKTARDRAEIAARVASFRETQQKFEREREEYYVTTLANALSGSGRSFWR